MKTINILLFFSYLRGKNKNIYLLLFLQGIQNKYVLVGYKPFSNTDEEFIICTTDKAKQHIEDTQTEIDRELRQKVDRSMHRVSGPWDTKNSEKDIEEIKPVQTREKV